MDFNDRLQQTILFLVPNLPHIVVYLIGLLLAVKFWRRYPQVSLLTLIAVCLGLCVQSTIHAQTLFDMWGRDSPKMFSFPLWSFAYLRTLAYSLATATAYGLLLWAAFGWRNQQPPKPPVVE